MSRPETPEGTPMGGGEVGMLRAEVARLGKDLREAMVEMRQDLKDGLAELRDAHDKRKDEINELKVAMAKAPTEARVAAIEETQKKHGETLAGLTVKVGLGAAVVAGVASFLAHLIFH